MLTLKLRDIQANARELVLDQYFLTGDEDTPVKRIDTTDNEPEDETERMAA